MKRVIKPYYVLSWNFNKDALEQYNIMPYLIDCYKKIKKSRRKTTPTTFDEIKQFILDMSLYQFCSRCQYEIIITGWPKHKNEVKTDIHYQIVMNIDTITKHFMEHL